MIRALLVDDSPTVRAQLRRIFSAAPDFQIVGEATTVAQALEQIVALKPDVVLLDVFLPDGTAAQLLVEVLRLAPVPVVLISDAPKDAQEVFSALEAGALDFASKAALSQPESAQRLIDTTRALQRVAVRRRRPARAARLAPTRRLEAVVIASSAGGPGPLRSVLAELPPDFGAVVLVAQHMAAGFEDGFSAWLSNSCKLPVRVCGAVEALRPGTVLLGRAGHDLTVRSSTEVTHDAAPLGGNHPSADRLFETAAAVFGASTVGIVLSGMGRDGAVGAKSLRDAGGDVWAQSSDSAAVSGMPGAVSDAGLASWQADPVMLGRALAERAQRDNRSMPK